MDNATAIAASIGRLYKRYIIKNLVLISAGVVIGATVRGGQLVADPERIRLDPRG